MNDSFFVLPNLNYDVICAQQTEGFVWSNNFVSLHDFVHAAANKL
jgi:hypothetical protein